MDTKEFLIDFKTRFDQYLSEYLRKKQLEYWQISEEFANFFAKLEDFTMRGGKRHRSALLYYTAKLFNPNLNDKHLMHAAILMEMVQAFLLIHDDIADDDDLRRGGLTVHKMFEYEAQANQWSNTERFGRTMGIYSGDTASMLIFQIIGQSNFEDSIKTKLTTLLSSELIDTVIGQFHDGLLENIDIYTEKHIEFIQKYKTGKYSFGTPSMVGAILGGASDEMVKTVEDYAVAAGTAFQIRDDILGIFGDESKTGKSAYADLRQGKKTLLILKALENGNEEQKQTIKKYLGKTDITAEQAEEVRQIIRDTGSLEYSIELSQKYVKEAKLGLSKLPNKDSESWKFIDGLIEYIAVREV